jgi:Protein of unknown function (DUF4054)
MAVATFNPVAFKARYPEFAAIDNSRLAAFFDEAGLYLSNTDASPVQDVTRRTTLLNMLTAHIAFIGGVLTADGQPRPVGRMSQASEGSVSASFEDVTPTPGSGAWFRQSQYGAAFWQATTNLRSFNYIPGPCLRV